MISGSALNTMKTAANQSKRFGKSAIGIEGWANGNGDGKGKEKPKEPAAKKDEAPAAVIDPKKIDMFKFVGRIPDEKLAEGLTSIADVDSTGGLGNKVLNDQQAWLNNWYATRAPKFGIPYKPVKPHDVIFRGNKGMGGELKMGKYDPISKGVEINKDVPGSQIHSTYLHEANHGYQDELPGVSEQIKNSVWGALWKDYPLGGYNSYSGSPDEIHSRLMQLRYENKIDPNATITLDDVKKLSKEQRQRHNLDIPDQQLMDLLNKVVSVQKKDTSTLA